MIVGPNKGLFFLGTALMCSASLYGAETAVPSGNPLARIFTGEPNRLTLPPGFPDAPLMRLDQNDESCPPQLADTSASAALHTAATAVDCRRDTKPEPTERVPTAVVPALAPRAPSVVSVGGTVQSH